MLISSKAEREGCSFRETDQLLQKRRNVTSNDPVLAPECSLLLMSSQSEAAGSTMGRRGRRELSDGESSETTRYEPGKVK